MQSRKAVTLEGMPVYFNNLSYFNGVDTSDTIGEVARKLEKLEDVHQFLAQLRHGRTA